MQSATIEGFRLSPQQAHLWRLHLDGDALTQRAHCTVRINGPLNPTRLHEAIAAVVDHYEILRTTFQRLPAMEMPLQVVDSECQVEFAVLAPNHASVGGRGQNKLSEPYSTYEEIRPKANGLANGVSNSVSGVSTNGSLSKAVESNDNNSNGSNSTNSGDGFGISRENNSEINNALTMLATLEQTDASQHLLRLSLSALYADAVGLERLVSEIAVSYAALSSGEESLFDEDALQYIDIADWQNELLESEDTAAGRRYWRQHKIADLLSINMPFARRGHPSEGVGQIGTSLPPDTLTQVEALAQQSETTAEAILLACWQIVIARLTAHEEVLVGVTYDGRQFDELSDAIGLFAKTLPMRTAIDPDRIFAQLVTQLHNERNELANWQEYFAWEHLGWEQESNTMEAALDNPAFPICFEYEPPLGQYSADVIAFMTIDRTPHVDRYRVKLSCQPKTARITDGMDVGIHYDADLFARNDMVCLLDQFITLLNSAVQTPTAPLRDLNMVSTDARQTILETFNQTGHDFGPFQPFHQLFEAQAVRQPNAVAAIFEEQQITYGELNNRANNLAYYLHEQGVINDKLVAISLDRGLNVLVAMLATLKAGGAYLPLDPKLPAERRAAMIDDAQPQVVLDDSNFQSATNHQPPATSHKPQDLAYVLYTSGSTGKPKGVCITHGNLWNYVHAVSQQLDLPANGHYATVTTFAADLGNTTIFPALCRGGCLHIISQERASDAAALADYFRHHAIDVLKIVPSHLAALLNSSAAADLLPRQHLIVGGEAFPWTLAEQVQALAPTCRITNHYGPTEATVGVIVHTLSSSLDKEQEEFGKSNHPMNHQTAPSTSAAGRRDLGREYATVTVPTGRPLANTQLYLLDEQMQPVPIGTAGELYIGGAQVARGYLNRPELTAERFVEPAGHWVSGFGDTQSRLLYRTGDLARFLPDGTVEFLGRSDHQIKIRGFRIELGEIEATLREKPTVQECVVIVQDREDGDKRLVAYVVPATEGEVNTDELRTELSKQLPDYMVPTAFVVLDAIPLTSNGKIDRRALPEPEELRPSTYVAPCTPIEETIAKIWVEVLGLIQVGIYDDFFALGGHSLMATQLISRISAACTVDLPLRQLFETPTVAGLSSYIERAEQTCEAEASMERASRNGPLPLSFAQQRLWFLNQLEPESAFYNLFASVHLRGQLNEVALTQTFNEIVRRHEILRTTFPTMDGKATQMIWPVRDLDLRVLELSNLPEEDSSQQAQQIETEMAQHAFDLANGPLFKIQLIRLAANEHLLLLVMHHIVSDGWSSGILVREMAELYRAFVNGEPSPLAELPVQYADYAQWQRNWLDGEVLEKQLDYWKTQLGGELPVLQLPTDRPRPAVQKVSGARYAFELSSDLSESLNRLCQQEGVTQFMLLLAGFKLLLHRYTGQDDLIVGSPIANRNRREIEGLIGFFVNTLALRTDLSNEPTARELIGRIRSVVLDAVSHQDLPFERLVDELQPDRDLSRNPLFQIAFVLGNTPRQALELPGLTLSTQEVAGETAKFDLTLYMTETADGLIGRVEYNTDLFDESTIARMTVHFQNVLNGMVANPDQSIADVPLLTGPERYQLLHEWNQIEQDPTVDECLHQRFEAQAHQRPDAVAVSFDTSGEATNSEMAGAIAHSIPQPCHSATSLTYRELNKRANQLAHHLRGLGVDSETLVAIYMERSVEMIVSILGVLKAGAAYVPMDPVYPPERIAFMLEDTAAPVILTQHNLVNRLPASGSKRLCLDTDWEQIAAEATTDLTVVLSPGSTAYVIYTSGSTGQPKGVMVSHQNVMRLFHATDDWYGFNECDVWTLFHSYAFDFSVWELWGALLYGGRLVVVPYWVSRQPDAFYNLLIDEAVTVLNQTPSAFRQLIQAEEDRAANWQADKMIAPDLSLRYIIFGGEALELESLRPWFNRHGDEKPQLVNMYGITETTVHVTYRPITLADLDNRSGSVIGRAIPDLSLYILDQKESPVPIGIGGELYVGGAGVAKGYLNRPELTAEKFIEELRLKIDDSFASERIGGDGHRNIAKQPLCERKLYRTGDLARYLPNGDIEYLGRIDQQVKIRGFRIELGEIEATLAQHPDLREAVVVVRTEGDNSPSAGEKRLAAYLVAHQNLAQSEAGPSITELRAFLQTTLPDYMVPAAFVWMDELPLTPNGKLDRRALPDPFVSSGSANSGSGTGAGRANLSDIYEPPTNEIETQLVSIWANVLGIENVGIRDNFFALGGDSILSIQIIARANQAGLTLTPKQIFQHQTIAELAKVAGLAPVVQAEQGLVTGWVPLTPIQQWFFEQELPHPDHWNQARLIEVSERLDPALLAEALNHLIAHHDALRLRFEHTEVGWQQTHSDISRAATEAEVFSHHDLSTLAPDEQRNVLETRAATLQSSLDLRDGPLLRAALFTLGAGKSDRLLVVVHHLVIDGVSWRILLDDLLTVYQQLAAVQPAQLPPKTTSFKVWAVQLTKIAQSVELARELDYWTDASEATGALPTDFDIEQGANIESSAAEITVLLDVAQTTALLHEVPPVYNTQINDVLLTALIQTLAPWTEKTGLLIDMEGHGREDLSIYGDEAASTAATDISRTVGWFTTIFPVCLTLASNEQEREAGTALMHVKEQLRAIPNRGVGYGLLRYLHPDESVRSRLNNLPRPQISFNYLGNFAQTKADAAGISSASAFAPAEESRGPLHHPDGERQHLLDIRGSITDGQLGLVWIYSTNIHKRSTIERLAHDYINTLQALIAHCQSADAGGFTQSDFELADLAPEELTQAFAEIEF